MLQSVNHRKQSYWRAVGGTIGVCVFLMALVPAVEVEAAAADRSAGRSASESDRGAAAKRSDRSSRAERPARRTQRSAQSTERRRQSAQRSAARTRPSEARNRGSRRSSAGATSRRARDQSASPSRRAQQKTSKTSRNSASRRSSRQRSTSRDNGRAARATADMHRRRIARQRALMQRRAADAERSRTDRMRLRWRSSSRDRSRAADRSSPRSRVNSRITRPRIELRSRDRTRGHRPQLDRGRHRLHRLDRSHTLRGSRYLNRLDGRRRTLDRERNAADRRRDGSQQRNFIRDRANRADRYDRFGNRRIVPRSRDAGTTRDRGEELKNPSVQPNSIEDMRRRRQAAHEQQQQMLRKRNAQSQQGNRRPKREDDLPVRTDDAGEPPQGHDGHDSYGDDAGVYHDTSGNVTNITNISNTTHNSYYYNQKSVKHYSKPQFGSWWTPYKYPSCRTSAYFSIHFGHPGFSLVFSKWGGSTAWHWWYGYGSAWCASPKYAYGYVSPSWRYRTWWRPTTIYHSWYAPRVTHVHHVYASAPQTRYVDPPREPCPYDYDEAWLMLADGNAGAGLSAFACLAQEYPYDGLASVGYAIANAMTGADESAVVAMRRAMTIDAEAIRFIPADSELDERLLSLVQHFGELANIPKWRPDALFMIASLKAALGDFAGAHFTITEAIRSGDDDASAHQLRETLARVLQAELYGSSS